MNANGKEQEIEPNAMMFVDYKKERSDSYIEGEYGEDAYANSAFGGDAYTKNVYGEDAYTESAY
jgi:hypothetical protein